jgi:quinone-modifying oxidoreductase, subunit QmoC
MSAMVNPDLLPNLKKFGVADASACFNCGNCTAVCSLASETVPFPRKFFRYLHLGFQDKIMRSPEPWLCYYCGDCSKTCPRQANPGEVMMGLRRYLTSSYEPTGIARLFYRNNVFAVFLTLGLSLLLTAFLLIEKAGRTGVESRVSRWLFGLVDYHFIEYMGVAVFAIVALSLAGGLVNIVRNLYRADLIEPERSSSTGGGKGRIDRMVSAGRRVINELVTLKRYRTCTEEQSSAWFLRPWFVHWAIMWGFVGLALATIMDIPLLGLKDPNVATFAPSRILGIGSGLLLLYGATIALIRRIAKSETNAENSRFSDWLFLILLWGLGITGFWLTASIYFFPANVVSQLVLLVHTVMAMELLLLFAFSKFAHAVYRPVALFFYYLGENT